MCGILREATMGWCILEEELHAEEEEEESLVERARDISGHKGGKEGLTSTKPGCVLHRSMT